MINVTERAKKELKRLLNSKVDWPQAKLRLLDRGEGNFGLGIDIESPGDVSLAYDGETILVCDSSLVDRVKNLTLDISEDEGQPEIIILGE